MIKKLLPVMLAALLASAGQAQVNLSKVGQTTMNFQLVNLSARAGAMGEAAYAISTGAEAIFLNPAGLAEMDRTFDANLMFTSWIADIKYKGGAFAWHPGNIGTFGFSAMTVDYGTINGTRLIANPVQGTEPYEDIGPLNNVGAYSFGLSYAQRISDQFSIGGTARWTGQNLGESILWYDGSGNSLGVKENNAAKMVFDIGVKYYTGFRSFRFAMAFRNFSSQLMREKMNEQMPVTFTIATAMDLLDVFTPAHEKGSAMTLGADYLHSNNFSERMNFGLEYFYHNTIALRGGYQTNRDLASWSAGLGVNQSLENYDVRLNYSYSHEDLFDGVNRISLEVGF